MLKSRDELLAELAKCDIVCANCHRARTYAAFMAGTIRPQVKSLKLAMFKLTTLDPRPWDFGCNGDFAIIEKF